MSIDLHQAGADYLKARRARGYRLDDYGWMLNAFADGLASRGLTTITVANALAFAHERQDTQLQWRATRPRSIRGLAAYVHALDPAAAELIPDGLICAKVTRRIPYLYTDEQVAELMGKAATLRPPLRAASIRTLIGLLATTGLRSGEATAIDVEDLDTSRAVMTVTGKYARQRTIPLHESTVKALQAYLRSRSEGSRPEGALFVGANGGRLNKNSMRAAFRALVEDCRLVARPGCGTPRLHDFRHTFAVNSLIEAHLQGGDIDARIAALATYLGHVSPVHTYWYYSDSRVIPIPAPLPAWRACDLG